MKMQPIDVDFEVFQLIQIERRGFDDTPNSALRRLLKLRPQTLSEPTRETPLAKLTKAPAPWTYKGVSLPNGTQLRMIYKGNTALGTVEDGKWRVGGSTFISPSKAACFVAKALNGKQTSLNGWIYWEAQLPDGKNWTPIDELRKGKPLDGEALGQKLLAQLGINPNTSN